MSSMRQGDPLPPADENFFRVFVPYELQITQRRSMTWGATSDEDLPHQFLGLYLLTLQPATTGDALFADGHGDQAAQHVRDILRLVLRESDIPGSLSPTEHLAVVRDLDPHQGYVVAQRLLAAAARSDVLRDSGVGVRLGYVIYPLSSQPNYPPNQWATLVDLARRLGERGAEVGSAKGFGVLRGPQAVAMNLPETDLVPLIFQDPDTLVKNGLLRLQRIHVV